MAARPFSVAAAYDPIASFYDLHWGDAFAFRANKAVQEHLGDLPRGATVLDLCCGTGLLLKAMSSLGWECFGVDESAAMLQLAAQKAPDSQLQRADMAQFGWTQRFDAAICLYNGINHARSACHLAAALRRVRSHLKHDGLFLFDYILPAAFATDWDADEEFHAGGRTHAVRYRFDARAGVATCEIGRDVSIRQIPFDIFTIRKSLRQACFTPILEMPMRGVSPPGRRQLVLARAASA